jgi:N-acetylglucosamine kinase-like BadF-type ATPase
LNLVIGVDAGGSKTLCAVADDTGAVLSLGRGGPGNWQVSGIEGAREAVAASISAALASAGLERGQVRAAYFGMAGADRPADFERVDETLAPIHPWARWSFENDATIALRAEVPTGPGIGVICGSGTNVVGFDDTGGKVQIGGFGFAFGDGAGANHLGTMAMRHAWRGLDGRGSETSLVAALEEFFEVESLTDVVERLYAGSIRWGRLAPLVFTAAEQGDAVARAILVDVGEELAVAAAAAWTRLFGDGAREVTVVAGGSVFQRPHYPLLFDTFRIRLEQRCPGARVVRLSVPPVLGAVYCALELLGRPVSGRLASEFRANITRLEGEERVVI